MTFLPLCSSLFKKVLIVCVLDNVDAMFLLRQALQVKTTQMLPKYNDMLTEVITFADDH